MRLPSLATLCVLAASSSGCFSWDRREPLLVEGVTATLPAHAERVAVYFVEQVPHRPLSETIWDNVIGAQWDVEESHQIGFTQQYKAIPLVAPPIAAANVAIRTRLEVPFGRSFTDVFEAALAQAYPQHATCFDVACVNGAVDHGGAEKVMTIRLGTFSTWEGPQNHLNLYATGTCLLVGPDGTGRREYPFRKATLEKNLGGFFSTHAALIDAMNNVLHAFSEELVVEILSRSFEVPASTEVSRR
jgi:hypothetical protein